MTFPRGSCSDDLEASIKVLYDFSHPTDFENSQESDVHGLASPIVMVGPPGYQFNTNRKPVEIELPIPHHRKFNW